jgi:hypothetical protein
VRVRGDALVVVVRRGLTCAARGVANVDKPREHPLSLNVQEQSHPRCSSISKMA